jgi:GTP-binding protein
MFIDEVTIEVKAGDGGNGIATFRREKYVPHGGPDGGDGGRGGSIILEADSQLGTLLDFRYKRHYKAERGANGQGNKKFGKDAEDLILKVPVGTVIKDDETGKILADLSTAGQKAVIARGGVGGRGNSHFATSTHQTPLFAEKGEPGEERTLRLELRLLADVGIIGFPNVGKSTLISHVSAAKPKIANYPFTTLVPVLGVVRADDHSYIMADIPGLIEGAHEGAGLGIRFLKHVERTRLLLHVLDVSGTTGREPLQDFETVNGELAKYDERLASLPQLVALNKTDIPGSDEIMIPLKEELENRGYEVFEVSAFTGTGLKPLVYRVAQMLEEIPKEAPPPPEMVVFSPSREAEDQAWEARQVEEGLYEVVGRGVEKVIAMTDLDNEEAVSRLQRRLERMGIFETLRRIGAKTGDNVRIGKIEFDYVE